MFADRADETPHLSHVRVVKVVRHPAGLVTTNVDVRAREDGCHAGQHLLDQLEGGGQLWVEPDSVVRVTRWELKLNDVSTAVQVRMHAHDRESVPRRVDLRHDGDEVLLRVGGERTEIRGVVEVVGGPWALGRSSYRETPTLVVGQVQVQYVELVERQKVDQPSELVRREEPTCDVERKAAPGVPRCVENPRSRKRNLPCVGGRCSG